MVAMPGKKRMGRPRKHNEQTEQRLLHLPKSFNRNLQVLADILEGKEGGNVSDAIRKSLEPIIKRNVPADRLYTSDDFPIEEDSQ
jgi:transposase